MKAKRYYMDYGGYDGWAEMREDEDGKYVEWNDYAAAQSRISALESALGPFVETAEWDVCKGLDDSATVSVRLGDCRAARRVMEAPRG